MSETDRVFVAQQIEALVKRVSALTDARFGVAVSYGMSSDNIRNYIDSTLTGTNDDCLVHIMKQFTKLADELKRDYI